MTETGAGADARAKIRERLRKLLAMTAENGASEAEALAAAQKAADLMAEHDLTYESIDEVKAERYGARRQPTGCSKGIATEIGRLFDCQCWLEGDRVVYFGTEADTAAAHSMRHKVCLMLESEWQAYQRSPARRRSRLHMRTQRAAFMDHMKVRLNRELEDMRLAREAATRRISESTGRALEHFPHDVGHRE